jgi:hypothetical protein
MNTEHFTLLNAALVLPGIYFICQGIALTLRISVGLEPSRAWKLGTWVAALVYSVLLGTHVTPLVHTLSMALPADAVAQLGSVAALA